MPGLLDRIAAEYNDPRPTSLSLNVLYHPEAVAIVRRARMRWARRQRRRRRRANRRYLKAQGVAYECMGAAVRGFAGPCPTGRFHQLVGEHVESARAGVAGGTLACVLCGELIYVPPGDVDTLGPAPSSAAGDSGPHD